MQSNPPSVQSIANRSLPKVGLHKVPSDASTRHRKQPGDVMQTATNLSRVLSAALALACSLVLLAAVGEQMNPSRLAASPQVHELGRVVVTAPAHTTFAKATAHTATN
jgi:hypothetical protein